MKNEATSLGEGKLWIQIVKLCFKIDLVSYPARAEGLVNMDMQLKNEEAKSKKRPELKQCGVTFNFGLISLGKVWSLLFPQ